MFCMTILHAVTSGAWLEAERRRFYFVLYLQMFSHFQFLNTQTRGQQVLSSAWCHIPAFCLSPVAGCREDGPICGNQRQCDNRKEEYQQNGCRC